MLGEMTAVEIEALLNSEVVARLGCHAAGQIYVVPVTYAYRDGCLYVHTAEGRKLDMMRANPNVCVEVDQFENLANWQSVIAEGHVEELTDADAMAGLRVLLDRLMPLLVGETATPTHGLEPSQRSAATILRIRLGERSGRYERTTSRSQET